MDQRTSVQSGQSLLEFLMMLPMLVGLSSLLMNINTAIQMGIVNQQYARYAAFGLTYNSPYYPALMNLNNPAAPAPRDQLLQENANQIVTGVSDNNVTGANYQPKASQQLIARKASLAPPNQPQDESSATMGWVRIRNSVTLCTDTFNNYPPRDDGSGFQNICASGFSYE